MLPNFLCIGAQKCGTTTIWRMLDAHPDIFMARPRETRFFYDDFQFFSGIQNYEIAYFAGWDGQPSVGEKCPEYLYAPNVAQRIRQQLGPDMKFIVALRNPAERAFSHYRHNLAMLRESRTFADVLDQEAEVLAAGGWSPIPFGYLGRGLYTSQIQAYLELFPQENFLFVNFEREIVGDQQRLANRIYAFLGVENQQLKGLPFRDGKPSLAHLTIRVRPTTDPSAAPTVEIAHRTFFHKRARALLAWLRGESQIGGKLDVTRIQNPSQGLVTFANAFTANRPTASGLLPKEALAINQRHFAADIAQLSALIPFPVDDWLSESSSSGTL